MVSLFTAFFARLKSFGNAVVTFFTTLRVGRFPEWKHEGWQLIGYFGTLPDPRYHVELILGWRTLLFGFFKSHNLPTEEDAEITGEHIKGFLIQGQIWLPFDRFDKM